MVSCVGMEDVQDQSHSVVVIIATSRVPVATESCILHFLNDSYLLLYSIHINCLKFIPSR